MSSHSWALSVTFLVLRLLTSLFYFDRRSGGILFFIHWCIKDLIESNQAFHMASHSNWPDILLAQAVTTRSNRPAHESCNRQKSSLIALQKCQAKSLAAGVAYYGSKSPKTLSVISPALSFPFSFQGLTWWLSGLRVCQRFALLVWRERVQCSNRRHTGAWWNGFRLRGGIIGASWCTGALKCSPGALLDSLLTFQTQLATCDQDH